MTSGSKLMCADVVGHVSGCMGGWVCGVDGFGCADLHVLVGFGGFR